ncbi:MAG: hypothetical protein AAGD22_17685 [Verrucomicrobiota bacterium]
MKRQRVIETPYGGGRLTSGTVVVPWKRHRGVMISLSWNEGDTPEAATVEAISQRLDSFVDKGLKRIGVQDFPPTMQAVLPELIDFSVSDGDFSLSFYCPDDEDYLVGVVFRDGSIVDDWEGH